MSQLISVQQRSEQPDEAGNWQAVVRINNGPENHITISNPSAGEEEHELPGTSRNIWHSHSLTRYA